MSKTNLPIEERAVRIAQMDTAGNDIAKEFEDVAEDIADFAVDIAALQQAVAGVVAFDGEYVDVVNNYYPSLSGVRITTEFAQYCYDNASATTTKFIKLNKQSTNNIAIITKSGTTIIVYVVCLADNFRLFTFRMTERPTEPVEYTPRAYLYTYEEGHPETWDTSPTQNSNKPCTSGGIYTAIAGIQSGTKLYQHIIESTYEGDSQPRILLITSEGTPLTQDTDGSIINSAIQKCVNALIEYNTSAHNFGVTQFSKQVGANFVALYVKKESTSATIDYGNSSISSDTVTAL